MTEHPHYALDTNIYVRAAKDSQFKVTLASFVKERGILVSAIVAAEFLIGYPVQADRRRVLRELREQGPPHAPRRVDWLRAAHAITRLGGDRVTKTRSFWNDTLLAAQCARLGVTLITANSDDFARLSRFIPVRVTVPFPS